MNKNRFVGPGDVIWNYEPSSIIGSGCYQDGGQIRASTYGYVEEIDDSKRKKVSIISMKQPEPVIQLNSKVYCRAQKISSNYLMVEILVVEDTPLKYFPKGVIKREDMLQAKDINTAIYDIYKPGDIIKAEVISLSDSRQYYLRTNTFDSSIVKHSHLDT
jgi:exosome complex component CSL4